MLTSTSTFPTDLGICTRVGLTRGVGRPAGAITSFAEAETRYREERLIARRERRAARRAHRPAPVPRQRTSTEGMSHWLPRRATRSAAA